MINPFEAFKDDVDKLRIDIERAAELAILTEWTKFNLSRMSTLTTDQDKAAKYMGMVVEL